jgi:acyl dehydratase
VTREVVPPPSRELIRDFVRFCGGDPGQHSGAVPPHLFSQWSLPVLLEVAKVLPYPPVKVINAGFRLGIDRPIPVGSRLEVSGQLMKVEESERGASIEVAVETAAVGEPRALRAEIRVLVPSRKKEDVASSKANGTSKEKPRVPTDARVLVERRLSTQAGLDFAELTGDFNPIHWIAPYARAMRFRNVILHGFGTAAIAFEAIGRAHLSGRFSRLRSIDVSFTRPLVLPSRVAVCIAAGSERTKLWVGDAPGGPAYLSGHVTLGD